MQDFYYKSTVKIEPSDVAAVLAIATTDMVITRVGIYQKISVPDATSLTSTRKSAILARANSREITAAEWQEATGEA